MTLGLTAEERAAVCAYVRSASDRLGLRDWTFELDHEPANDRKVATVDTIYGRRIAHLRLDHGFRDQSPKEQREVLIHELLHVARHAIRHLMEESLSPLLGKPAFTVFYEAYVLIDEQATDDQARAIAPFFPLLELPTIDASTVPIPRTHPAILAG